MANDTHARFGRIGIWSSALHPSDPAGLAAASAAVAELDALGYGTVWIGGSPSLDQVLPVLAASSRLTVATGILSIWEHTAPEVAERTARIQRDTGGRFVLGLGVSHAGFTPRYARPYSAMVEYLDALDAAPDPVPGGQRVLAALGPRMLKLAAGRAVGAHPYLVTVEHTAEARAALGPDALLAPELGVVLDTDLDRARAVARDGLAMYLGLPNYTDNLLRLGFREGDFADGGSDRLLDALFALGDAGTVRDRVGRYLEAGADHVALQVLTGDRGDRLPLAEWRTLASALELAPRG
ncbi:LLM class F420-dependent oxidoreductase [Streptomyces sp. NBC_01498]|uniref:LLM class F420-dependent oxidoreductase n=1 Tax=Streptomyces sp. NBC_01498 TaxID=2975870 RepID=UPI002E7B50A3|nr:LLM class F420-dependent oxidoreductase [Streptomyces sp. NBC_01498]WTL23243.1 LLM class F420-dependent oxidoreductase [Streptomyces sp. NBC_01498]